MMEFLRNLLGLSGERSPQEPVRFQQSIRIKATPEDLFPLIDWSDERHLWRQMGHEVRRERDGFTLRISDLPATRFDIRVTGEAPPALLAYDSETVPMVGKLIASHEEYRLEPIEDGECEVTLAVDARFVPGLRPRVWRFEQWKMRVSCHNALAKLKLMAEQGLEAVEAASRRLVV